MRISPSVDSDDTQEWFAYTVGLCKTFSWPELICFGLDQDTMHQMLNSAVEECRERGERPRSGVILKEVLSGFEVKLAPISRWDWVPRLGWARWLSDHYELQRDQFDRLQLLWPDKAGRFPDEPLCDEAVRKLQTPTPDEALKALKAND